MNSINYHQLGQIIKDSPYYKREFDIKIKNNENQFIFWGESGANLSPFKEKFQIPIYFLPNCTILVYNYNVIEAYILFYILGEGGNFFIPFNSSEEEEKWKGIIKNFSFSSILPSLETHFNLFFSLIIGGGHQGGLVIHWNSPSQWEQKKNLIIFDIKSNSYPPLTQVNFFRKEAIQNETIPFFPLTREENSNLN